MSVAKNPPDTHARAGRSVSTLFCLTKLHNRKAHGVGNYFDERIGAGLVSTHDVHSDRGKQFAETEKLRKPKLNNPSNDSFLDTPTFLFHLADLGRAQMVAFTADLSGPKEDALALGTGQKHPDNNGNLLRHYRCYYHDGCS